MSFIKLGFSLGIRFSSPLTGTPSGAFAVNDAMGNIKHIAMAHTASSKNRVCFLCIIFLNVLMRECVNVLVFFSSD